MVRVVAAAVVLAAGLSGCSGESTPIETPETVGIPGKALPVPGEGATSGPVPTAESPSSPPVTSVPGSGPSAATPQDGGFSNEDLRTSVAFVREYLAAYNASVKKPVKGSLTKYVLPSCQSCAGLQQNIDELARRRERQVEDGIRIVRIRPDFALDRFVVVAQLDQPASPVVDLKGRTVDVIKAEAGARRAFVLQRVGSGWKMKHIKIYSSTV